MTKISVWCRHEGDSIIGIGSEIPWNVPSDSRRFRKLTEGQTLVAGKNTYESFPNRTLPNRRFLVLTRQTDYEVSDVQNHRVVNDINSLKDYPEDLYIAGGAAVYDAFFTSERLRPEIAVDCVYHGSLKEGLAGNPATVAASVEVLEKMYLPLPQTFELDNVTTTVRLLRNAFVEQKTVKKILQYLETEGK